MSYKVFVDVSARHVHLRPEDVEILFGSLDNITPRDNPHHRFGKMVIYNERLEIKGPKDSIKSVPILGPLRRYLQVEVSMTDARALGLNPPVRASGDVKGSEGCTIIGPKGELKVDEGVILAWRHLHINDKEAAEQGFKDGDIVSVKITGTSRPLQFDNVMVETHPTIQPTVHIDTDEANAAGITVGTYAEIIR